MKTMIIALSIMLLLFLSTSLFTHAEQSNSIAIYLPVILVNSYPGNVEGWPVWMGNTPTPAPTPTCIPGYVCFP